MVLETAKCPNCGANIELDPKKTFFVCGYCGANILTKDATDAYKEEQKKEYRLKIADECLEKGILEDAEKIYKEISKEFPNDYRGWWGIIRSNPAEANRLDPMDTIYKKAIAFAPDDKKAIIEKHKNIRDSYINLKHKEHDIVNKCSIKEQTISEKTYYISECEKKLAECDEKIRKEKTIGFVAGAILAVLVAVFFQWAGPIWALSLALIAFGIGYSTAPGGLEKLEKDRKWIIEGVEKAKTEIEDLEKRVETEKTELLEIQSRLNDCEKELAVIKESFATK